MLIKMAEKRRWFSKVFSDSQESRNDTDISWSNSDSEPEATDKSPVKKRLKISNILGRNKSDSWLNIMNSSKTPIKKEITINSRIQDDFLNSPILSGIKLEDQSPILTQNDREFIKRKSPVIRRNKIIKKIRWRYHYKMKNDLEMIKNKPSDLCSSQPLLITDTPTQLSPNKTQHVISPTKSELSQNYIIDPFPSQNSSEVITDSFISSTSNGKSSDNSHPPPRRKKYKKGGLASQLQKAINLQNSSASIWNHEVFLCQAKDEDFFLTNVSDGVEFEFNILNKWNEYGCEILECKCKNQDMERISSHSTYTNFGQFESFLMVFNLVKGLNDYFEIKHCYRIFPPYDVKIVENDSKKILCIFNASRIISA